MIGTTNSDEYVIRLALGNAPADAEVDLRLIDGSVLTGTVTVAAEGLHGDAWLTSYRVATDSGTWTVPAGHVLAVRVPA